MRKHHDYSGYYYSFHRFIELCVDFVSSLSYRAKGSVHKCNGAGNMTILSMFLWETRIIILFALILGWD